MKRFMALALVAIGAVCVIAETPESKELEEFVKKYETAWQSHDGGKLAGFFARPGWRPRR